jgi:hypothetical protein
LAELANGDEEVFGEVMALLTALEEHGRALGDAGREESHPVVSSRFDMHALRRTPPSEVAPFATELPVLRVPYGICRRNQGGEEAVILLGGDKTQLGSTWYPPNIAEAEQRLEQYCRRHPDLEPIVKRGGR